MPTISDTIGLRDILTSATKRVPVDLVVLPFKLMTANGEALKSNRLNDAVCYIHNLGTNAIKYLIDDANDANADNFHDVIAAGAAVDDGTGGQVEILVKNRVTIYGADGNAPRASVIRYENLSS